MTALHPINAPQLKTIPKTACGQCVNLFAAGYMKTGKRAQAPLVIEKKNKNVNL